MTNQLQELLENNLLKKDLKAHPLFQDINAQPLSREQVAILIGQFYHAIHYFPVFLSRAISVTPHLAMQTFMSKILWQELGEGNVERAHETLYIKTMLSAGFAQQDITEAPINKETQELLDGFRESTTNYLSGVGFLYGIEAVDLPMVSAIGEAVKKVSSQKNLPWVSIHVKQEPDHVDSTNHTLRDNFTDDERAALVQGAEKMWELWINFFTAVKNETQTMMAPA